VDIFLCRHWKLWTGWIRCARDSRERPLCSKAGWLSLKTGAQRPKRSGSS